MKHSRLPLVISSFAKLNLYLQVLNKRKDNFHNLRTLFARLDLADTIILRDRKDSLIKIKCSHRQVPQNKTNLCWRAADLLKQEFRLVSGVEIEIKKRIPIGAGLGGGSANAASVLLGLNQYWHLNLSKAKLAKLAARLGSDVAFFIYNTKFALGRGRGEKIKPLTALQKIKLWFILVYPKTHVSTPLIYRQFDRFKRKKAVFFTQNSAKKQSIRVLTRPRHDVKLLISRLSKWGSRVAPEYLFNSLESVATSLYPEINQAKKALYGMGLEQVLMSGSGATVFALCSSENQAKDLSRKLRKEHRSWQVFVVSTV